MEKRCSQKEVKAIADILFCFEVDRCFFTRYRGMVFVLIMVTVSDSLFRFGIEQRQLTAALSLVSGASRLR